MPRISALLLREVPSRSGHLSSGFFVFLWVRKPVSLSPEGGAAGVAWGEAGFRMGTVPSHTRKLSLVVRHVAVYIQWSACSLHPRGLAHWASCISPWASPSWGFYWGLSPQLPLGPTAEARVPQGSGMEQAHGGQRVKALGCGRHAWRGPEVGGVRPWEGSRPGPGSCSALGASGCPASELRGAVSAGGRRLGSAPLSCQGQG